MASTIGILGGGQLAKMLSLAAKPLGIQTICIDASDKACAADVCPVIKAPFDNERALQELIDAVDVVTYETENVPLETAEWIAEHRPVFPSVTALAITQDRLKEKLFLNQHQVPTARFAACSAGLSLHHFCEQLIQFGLPCLIKTRRFGYDGKGQFLVRTEQDLAKAWATLGTQETILENLIEFKNEFSLISVRNSKGEIVHAPLTENFHHHGILIESRAPVDNLSLATTARQHADAILKALDYVGVLTIEFFYDGNQLIANEMAPRVHNSGHWTLEGCESSQFEQHVRAVCGLAVGSFKTKGNFHLYNLIGALPNKTDYLTVASIAYHDYGKAVRPGRKVGHLTMALDEKNELSNQQKKLASFIKNIF